MNTTRKYERVFNLVDDSYELVDPNPDIHELFMLFDQQFFWGTLTTRACTVEWSKRMTSCAGICQFYGKSGLCCVRLSEPLLKLRKRKDLIETLLHEMIHAFLFLTEGPRFMDRDGHGPEFQSHMHRINSTSGTSISIYHSFHAEVSHYKQHWWRCTGPCKDRAPYYGWVKRANNRAPGSYDFWWKEHQMNCNGSYVKVKEPEKKQNQTKPKKEKPSQAVNKKEQAGTSSAGIKRKVDKPTTSSDPRQPKIDKLLWGEGHVLGNPPIPIPDGQDDICIMEEIKRPQLEPINNKPPPLFPGKGYQLGSK